jgi:hypothetical protein
VIALAYNEPPNGRRAVDVRAPGRPRHRARARGGLLV